MDALIKKPKTDPDLARRQAEAKAKAEREQAAQEAFQAEERSARARGLRGARSLLSNGQEGFAVGARSLVG